MAKDLASPYEAGSRGSAWLKIKRAHTLDLVILAAEWGHGRRQGWLSNLHLGARDPESGAWVMLGKTFKGLTDEMLAWQTSGCSSSRPRATATPSTSSRRWWSRSRSTTCRRARATPAASRCGWRASRPIVPDKTPADADTFDRVRAIWEAQVGARAVDGSSES